jgi:hypothetical protein
MKGRWTRLAIPIGIAVALITLLLVAIGAADPLTSRVRLVHAIPGAPAVQVVIDGETAYSEVSYTTVTTYTTLPVGLHTVEVWALLPPPLPPLFLISETLPLVGGVDLTVMGIGTTTSPSVTLLPDNNTIFVSNTVRLVNLSHDITMTVNLTGTEGTAQIDDLQYPQASGYIPGLGVGEVNVEVRVGDAVMGITPSSATLESDAIHSLFIMGPEHGLSLIPALDQKFETLYQAYLPLAIKEGDRD